MSLSVAAGIDLGGTFLKIGLVDAGGRLLAKKSIPARTSERPGVLIDDMAASVCELLREVATRPEQLSAVGVGSPGPLSMREGRIYRTANLPAWNNVPLRDELFARLGRTVVVENDGNAAAYGEYWAGAGRDRADLVMFTLGTGVGGGVVLDGRVLHGHFENAAELGHTIVCPDGIQCGCGQRGCLEQYASAAAVARRVKKALAEGTESTIVAASEPSAEITSRHVAQAAQEGDELCATIWDEACKFLAIACINVQHTYNPAYVVLGGGLADAREQLLIPVQRHLAAQRWSLLEDLPEVRLAVLGYDAGIIGAAGLAWQQIGQSSGT